MNIHLRPELEEQIRQDIQHGPYQTVDEYIEHAVSLLHEQESWFASHSEAIAEQIEAGWNSATSGDLAGEAEVRSRMQEKKLAFPDRKRTA
jgi:putative addiction module CopG family antidote